MSIVGRPRPTAELVVEASADMVEEFRTHGFTSVERITTDEEVDWLRGVFDDLYGARVAGGYFDLARPYDGDGADLLPQALFPERAIPALRDTTYVRNARRIAAALLDADGDDLDVWGHMIDKPPHTGHETPWHQDEAYWDPTQRFHAVGAWMPLDDCDEGNGCMTFLPGSHRGDVLPHRHIADDPAVHGLQFAVDVDVAGAVSVPLRAGGATFHHPRHLPLHRRQPFRPPAAGVCQRAADAPGAGRHAGSSTLVRRDRRRDGPTSLGAVSAACVEL